MYVTSELCWQVCDACLKRLRLSRLKQSNDKILKEKRVDRIRFVCWFGIGDISMNSCKGGEEERGREDMCEAKVNNVQCYNYRHII